MFKYLSFSSVILMLLLFGILSCGQDYYYSSEVEIPNEIWNNKKAAIFEPTFSDTTQNYNIILGVTNSNEYRYSNIWFFIKTISPEGFSHRDTMEIFIAEDDGKWIGKREGDRWTTKFYFKNNVRFPGNGRYTFEIIQGMRDIDLKGISKVQLFVEKLKKSEE